ncbi:Fe-dependent oxidoreductase, alcohol dehydrogenase [Thermanaerovibrio velox DSM 12556]|uniref:Fe-dependent oxidoreductase, alcohol dehydrogenase n=1 Tax=Thermanaerovibrio velox DSM 12556 TaxID=926567 RepID=H0UNE7_9BACT|nr:iron-containing alcohol dehydrogenase [Thermanaerovibrio velox]EHM09354.1 Fe-dependent oxidoreductase, alcohol dehydrogenase [Thermanaerovibrio velox DSM 12556]
MKFSFYNPTRLIFGARCVSKLGEAAASYGSMALLVTGRGSVKRSGAFERAVESLKTAGVSFVECEGVEPNPRISTVRRGAEMIRRHRCDLVVALGGGSVMDAAKVMAAAALYEGDPWDMMYVRGRKPRLPDKALPVITVPTLAATGSEMNEGAVISSDELKVKTFVEAECLFPRVAVVDPELTLSVPRDHTAYGVSDIIAHLTEGYFNGVDGTPIQDGFAEAALRTVIRWGRVAVEDGSSLEARTQVQWASVVALNGWVQVGTRAYFPVHMMEHTLSALHDVPHGAGLAVLNPAWMSFAAPSRVEKFAAFARNVMEVQDRDDGSAAEEGIRRLREFLASIGCPSRISDMVDSPLEPVDYARATLDVAGDERGLLRGRPHMDLSDLEGIFKSVV